MKNKKVYINVSAKEREITYTGITFYDFIKYMETPINNIILLKSNCEGNEFFKNFELAEGKEYIDVLQKSELNKYGDFCFVDYENKECLNNVTDEHISELLFISHMFYPLSTPFFPAIKNRFAYLSHDNSFFCKLYCRDLGDFIGILGRKIIDVFGEATNTYINHIDKNILKKIFNLSEKGLLLDFDNISISETEISVKLYIIGKYTNMDEVINNYLEIEKNCFTKKNLKYEKLKGMFLLS